MIFISILIFIVAIALPSFKKHLSPILLTRITSIIFIYSGVLSFNALYIQSIGSGIGIYSGLFHVSTVSQQLDTFLLFIGALVLVPRPGIVDLFYNSSSANASGAEPYSTLTQGSKVVAGAALGKGLQSTNLKKNYLILVNSDLVSGLGGKYSLIVLFSTLGSVLLLSSSDLLSMYLSIELQSFGVYILATLFRDSKLATSAGLKYFLLGGLSSCLILLGSGLVYTYTGLTNLESIYSLISVNDSNTITQGLYLGIILILVGFLFKIAAAPLHNWAPDVYDDSPSIVTIWLTIMPKIAILIFLLDLFMGSQYSVSNLATITLPLSDITNITSTSPNLLSQVSQGYSFLDSENINIIKNLLLLSSLFSLIIGTVVGLAQSKIKRLLAYSTISHIGFILLALSINSEQSIESFLFYIIQYSITNLNTFLIILALGYLNSFKNSESNDINYFYNIENKDIRFIAQLKGQFMTNPLLSLSLAICLFSMAGIPPLIGFFSKQMVLYSAIQSGYYFMAIVAIIVSVISASYYLKIVRILFSSKDLTNNSSSANASGAEPYPLRSANAYFTGKEGSVPSSFASESPTPFGAKGGEVRLYFITNLHSFLISSLTLIILLFIFKPSIILNSTQLLSLSLFNC